MTRPLGDEPHVPVCPYGDIDPHGDGVTSSVKDAEWVGWRLGEVASTLCLLRLCLSTRLSKLCGGDQALAEPLLRRRLSELMGGSHEVGDFAGGVAPTILGGAPPPTSDAVMDSTDPVTRRWPESSPCFAPWSANKVSSSASHALVKSSVMPANISR